MKNLKLLALSIVIAAVGAFYFNANAESSETSAKLEASNSRYAIDALESSGSAVICGRTDTSSSTLNINRQLEDIFRYVGAVSTTPIESSYDNAVCLLLKKSS